MVRSGRVTGLRAMIISADETVKVTSTNQFFNFILECFAVLCSVAMIAVIATIFGHINIGGRGRVAWWWDEVSLQGLIKEVGSGDIKGSISSKAGLSGFSWSGIRTGGWWGGVGGGGCIVIAEFGVEGLHLLHANIVGNMQLELVHRGRWVEVDIVGEGAGLKGKDHALEDHFLVEVWGAKGCLTETINECPERLTLFLHDA